VHTAPPLPSPSAEFLDVFYDHFLGKLLDLFVQVWLAWRAQLCVCVCVACKAVLPLRWHVHSVERLCRST